MAICGPIWLKFLELFTTPLVISAPKFQLPWSIDNQEKMSQIQLMKSKYGTLNPKDEVGLTILQGDEDCFVVYLRSNVLKRDSWGLALAEHL